MMKICWALCIVILQTIYHVSRFRCMYSCIICACENPSSYPSEKDIAKKIERKVALDGNVWKKVSTRSDACQQNFLYAMTLYRMENQVDAMWWAKIEINSTFMSIMWTCAAWPLATVASMSQQVNGKRSFCFAIKYSFLLYLIVIARRQDSDGISPFFCKVIFFVSWTNWNPTLLYSRLVLTHYIRPPAMVMRKKPQLGWRWAASAIVAVAKMQERFEMKIYCYFGCNYTTSRFYFWAGGLDFFSLFFFCDST